MRIVFRWRSWQSPGPPQRRPVRDVRMMAPRQVRRVLEVAAMVWASVCSSGLAVVGPRLTSLAACRGDPESVVAQPFRLSGG